MASNLIWKAQQQLRKNPWLLPACLLLLASILVLREHMFSDRKDLRTFLTLVLATMVPLAYMDVKISSRTDPIGLLVNFGGKVLMMHSVFLALRFRLFWYSDVFYLNCLNVVGFFGSLVALFVGFRSQMNITYFRDTITLLVLAVGAATVTEVLTWGLHLAKRYQREISLEILGTASEYAEILAFVPAVWIIFRSDKKDSASVSLTPVERRLAATVFFGFLMGFYFFEDVIAAVASGWEDTMAAIAHILHYLLLGDVSLFLVFYAHNPEKAHSTFLQSLSDYCLSDSLV
jgi:hypothetical protein